MTVTVARETAPTWAHEPVSEDVLVRGSNWERVVHWYDATRLGTPAFWVEQTRSMPAVTTYQIGNALHEEVALCLLGGYGITETMAMCAFDRLRGENLLRGTGGGFEALHEALSRPFVLPGRDRSVRYRFPTLKARRLDEALSVLASATPPNASQPLALRDWLTTLPGVGLKTASWAVRNLTRSNDVAVIDVHIRRAGVAAGMFDPAWKLPRDYRRFEEAFVLWARIGDVPTADLDACIWTTLADLGRGARLLFGVNTLSELD